MTGSVFQLAAPEVAAPGMAALAAAGADGSLEVIPILVISIMGAIALVWIIFSSVVAMVRHSVFEKSRREVAAYVAEGTMSVDDATRLLNAGDSTKCDSKKA